MSDPEEVSSASRLSGRGRGDQEATGRGQGRAGRARTEDQRPCSGGNEKLARSAPRPCSPRTPRSCGALDDRQEVGMPAKQRVQILRKATTVASRERRSSRPMAGRSWWSKNRPKAVTWQERCTGLRLVRLDGCPGRTGDWEDRGSVSILPPRPGRSTLDSRVRTRGCEKVVSSPAVRGNLDRLSKGRRG